MRQLAECRQRGVNRLVDESGRGAVVPASMEVDLRSCPMLGAEGVVGDEPRLLILRLQCDMQPGDEGELNHYVQTTGRFLRINCAYSMTKPSTVAWHLSHRTNVGEERSPESTHDVCYRNSMILFFK